ncbi:lipid-transfer protein [Pseudonocardia ailaonensis]|uniref:Lipid-transfer protein n=1 Tax=Pseudonocardia ailaonensis TaxID=367279 RepID=A0ABN2N3I5_9PSEU
MNGLAVTAAREAVADAGLEPGDVDFILGYQESDSPGPQELATYLGLRECGFYEILSGGTSTESLVSGAVGLIASGAARNVLIYRTMLGRSGKRMGGGAGWTDESWETLLPGGAYLVPHGIFNAGQRVALLAAMHMHDNGIGEEALAAICETFYGHAQSNPTALMYGRPLTREAYFASPYIASPLRLHDFCVESDEANAILVRPAADVRESGRPTVLVRSVVPKLATAPTFHYNADDPTGVAGAACAARLYEQAGVRPSDFDVAAIYDCFSWVVLRQLEAYGLVPAGGAEEFVRDGQLGLGGSLPTNTAGGMLSEGYTHGLNNVLEIVRQLRADHAGTGRQVEGCGLGLVTGWAGPSVASGMVLEAAA